VQLVSGSLFVENIWAYFLTAGLICAWRGDVFPAAVLLGSACATKVGSWLPALATLGLLWFWHRIRIKSVVTFLLFAVPPYFTAWLQTGNPIFPFANATFRAPLFDLANSFVEARYQEPIRWDILYRLTFESHRFFEGTDGALGFQYLFAAPFVLLAMRGFRRLEMLASAAVLAAFVGLSLSQSNLRYLYPVMPAATILIGCAWRNLAPQTRWVAPAIAVVLVANICYLSNSGWHHRNFGPAPWRADAVAQYRDLQAPVRTMIDYLNLHHPGEPVIFLASGQSAGLHARAFIDSWHQYPFHERALACRNGAEWKELSNSLGVHLVLGPSGAAFTGSQSDFLQNYTEPVLSDGDLRLFRIKQ
jgi:hypothetical protein